MIVRFIDCKIVGFGNLGKSSKAYWVFQSSLNFFCLFLSQKGLISPSTKYRFLPWNRTNHRHTNTKAAAILSEGKKPASAEVTHWANYSSNLVKANSIKLSTVSIELYMCVYVFVCVCVCSGEIGGGRVGVVVFFFLSNSWVLEAWSTNLSNCHRGMC